MHMKKNEVDININTFKINYERTKHHPKIFLIESQIPNISF